jgi:hypothetical protein
MSEAIIQLNFSREETASGTKIQPIAFMDPITLVDSAAAQARQGSWFHARVDLIAPAFELAKSARTERTARRVARRGCEDVVKLVMGQSFVAAEKIMVPSGPNIVSTLGLAVALRSLWGSGWLCLLRPDRFAIRRERNLELLRDWLLPRRMTTRR